VICVVRAQVWDEVFNFLVEHKVKDLHVTVFLCHPVEGDKVRPSPALSLSLSLLLLSHSPSLCAPLLQVIGSHTVKLSDCTEYETNVRSAPPALAWSCHSPRCSSSNA
jgi:hypothetical protein